jgi:predicted hydrocarbon binding protein
MLHVVATGHGSQIKLPYHDPGKPADWLTCDAEKGMIFDGSDRIISFRVKMFQAMTDHLDGLVGPMTASVIFHQLGMAVGRELMAFLKARDLSQTELPAVLDLISQRRGWGRCIDMTCQSTEIEATYTFKVNGTPLSHERKSTRPSCDLIRGILSGCLEVYLNAKERRSVERECESMGNPFCTFEIVFDKRPNDAKTQQHFLPFAVSLHPVVSPGHLLTPLTVSSADEIQTVDYWHVFLVAPGEIQTSIVRISGPWAVFPLVKLFRSGLRDIALAPSSCIAR